MTIDRAVSRGWLAGASLIALALPMAATAQTAAAPANTAPTPAEAADARDPVAAPQADRTTGDDIIVTAQRGAAARQENVPASIVAVSGETLANAGVRRFQDLAILAPGVQISRSGAYTQPAIRGISTTFAGGGQETNVAVYVDGFYTSDQLSTNQDFANIESVEVLKGAQGTLYGRNATGGAILINTRRPTDTLQADFSVSFAPRYHDKIVSAFVGGPLANGLKLSIAAYYRDNDSYFRDINDFAAGVAISNTTYTFGGKAPPVNFANAVTKAGTTSAPFRNWSIRPKLVFDGIDGVDVTLGYAHSFINDPRAFAYGPIGQLLNAAATYNGYPTALNQRDRTSLDFRPVNASGQDDYNATIAIRLAEGHKITSRTAYRVQDDFQAYDLDGTAAQPHFANVPGATGTSYMSLQYNNRKTFIQQVDYDGQIGDLTLLGGLFYYNDRFQSQGIDDIGTATNPNSGYLDFRTKAWAGYLDATYAFADRLFVTLGGRYSHDEKKLSRVQYNVDGVFSTAGSSACWTDDANPVNNTACGYDPVKRVSGSAFTPRAVIRYNLAERTNVYASFSRGFKAPTLNAFSPFNRLRAEKVSAYEVGLKTAGGGFRGELSAFYYDYKDNQISALSANSPTITTLIQNSGGSKIYGVDLSLSYAVPGIPLRLRASGEYLHARYTDFDNATDVTISPANLNTSVIGSWTDRRLARAPDWSGSVGFDFTPEVAGGKLLLSATGTFSSRYAPQNASYLCTRVSRNASGADIPFVAGTQGYCASGTDRLTPGRFEEDGYFLANASLGWTDADEHVTATLFVDNLTKTRYKIISTGFAYFTYNMYNEPRTIGARLSYKY